MLKPTVGQPFELKLGAAAGAGYLWELPDIPPGAQVLRRDFIVPEGAANGDGGTQVFVLQSSRPGRCMLRFVLKRRWESAGIEERLIEIDVAPAAPPRADDTTDAADRKG